MICPKHGCIALTDDDSGWPLCLRCFQEANAHADDEALEQKIRDLRYNSAQAVIDRLSGRPPEAEWPR